MPLQFNQLHEPPRSSTLHQVSDLNYPTKVPWTDITSGPAPGMYVPSQFPGASYETKVENMLQGVYEDGGGIALVEGFTSGIPFTIKPGVHVQGYGHGRTIIKAANDFGPGTWLFDAGNPAFPMNYILTCGMSDLSLYGPDATRPAIGSMNCNMGGLRTGAQMSVSNVHGMYFNHGVCVASNHERFYNCLWDANWDGILFPDDISIGGYGNGTGGDQAFFTGASTHNKRSSIAVAGSNSMFNVNIANFKLCWGPIGLYKFDGINPSTNSFLYNCQFYDVTWEAYGNACIWDASTGGGVGANSMVANIIYTAHSLANSAAQFRNGSLQIASTCIVRNMRNNTIKGAGLPFGIQSGGTRVWNITGVCASNEYVCDRPGQASTHPTGADEWILGIGTSGAWTNNYYDYKSESRFTVDAVAIGELLDWRNNGQVRASTATDTCAGVAVTAGSAGGVVMMVPCGERGVLAKCTACTFGQKLYKDGVDPKILNPTINGDPIAIAMATGGGAGGVLNQVALM